MDETLTAAIRLIRTELDAMRIVQAHAELPQPAAEAVVLVTDALDKLTQAVTLLG